MNKSHTGSIIGLLVIILAGNLTSHHTLKNKLIEIQNNQKEIESLKQELQTYHQLEHHILDMFPSGTQIEAIYSDLGIPPVDYSNYKSILEK